VSKRQLHLFPLFLLAFAGAHAQDVTGDWIGTLNLPSTGDLRLALHISNAQNGLQATLDSVDQGASIPVDSIQFADSRLTFDLKTLQASYDGKVDAAATTIEGELGNASGSVPFILRRGTFPRVEHKPAQPSDIDGDWSGTLRDGDVQADVVIHIMNTEDGLVVTLDEPSQHVNGAEASSVKRAGASIVMEWNVFGSRYEGKIAEDRSAIDGTVAAGGGNFPLALKRKQ
jgi:hypothetical protein